MVDSAAFQISASPRPGVEMAAMEAGLYAALANYLTDGPT
jgi:zinc protease